VESALAACCLIGLLVATPAPQPPRTPTTRPTTTSTPPPTSTPAPQPTATATPPPTPTASPTPEPILARPTLIGRSSEERDIVAYALGSGPINVAIVGGMHGAAEANSAVLVWAVLHFYEHQPDAIPPSVTLLFLPVANPDGLVNGTRELTNGVDPNRNWPTEDWSPSSFGPHGPLPGGGGLAPLSEPETVTLANWIQSTQPGLVLSYHSAGGLVMGGAAALGLGLIDAYLVGASDYAFLEWSSYPVTGDFAQWCEDLGIPTVEVELRDHFDPDVSRNLAGIRNVLQAVEAIMASSAPY
jgi:protein MpaA